MKNLTYKQLARDQVTHRHSAFTLEILILSPTEQSPVSSVSLIESETIKSTLYTSFSEKTNRIKIYEDKVYFINFKLDAR